jgi:hypothetical protein
VTSAVSATSRSARLSKTIRNTSTIIVIKLLSEKKALDSVD